MPGLDMSPSPTQFKFIDSDALENCIVGPRGEGKSDAGIMAMSAHASHQDKRYRPIPWAVVRDTWTNIERTTLQSFISPPNPDSFPAYIRRFLQVREGGREVLFPGFWKVYFFGVDSQSDLNRFQSLQLGGVWLEEPAAAAQEEIGSGIGEDVWALGISSLRHPLMTKTAYNYLRDYIQPKWPNVPPDELDYGMRLGIFYTDHLGKPRIRNRRAQISMNYPEEDHWTWQRFHEQGIGQLFRIPKGENIHVDDSYRRNMYEALKNRPDLLARLVEGKPSQIQIGEKVTPEYDADFHRSKVVLYPVKDVPVIRCWDGWMNPSCVFCQITPRGQFRVLYTIKGNNIGMKQFIMTHVKPFISSGVDVGQKKQVTDKFKDVKIWRDMGDATIANPDQSDSSFSAAQVIANELESKPGEKARFEGGEQNWGTRRSVIKEILDRGKIDGEPMFQVSKDDVLMHKALSGKWAYKKNPDGTVIRDKPIDNDVSHPAAALTHALAKLYKYREKSEPKKIVKPYNVGKTYAVPGFYREEREA